MAKRTAPVQLTQDNVDDMDEIPDEVNVNYNFLSTLRV